MAVEIDLKLDAGNVAGEISAITAALEGLDAATDDIDLGELDIDDEKITGSIGNVIGELSDLQEKVNQVNSEIAELDDMGIEVQHEINTPDGDTGSGDSTGSDPPTEKPADKAIKSLMPDFGSDSTVTTDGGPASEGFNAEHLENQISDLFGFEKGRVNVPDQINEGKLKEIASDLDDIAKGKGGISNLGEEGILANFFGEQNDFEEMDKREIYEKGAKAGVMGPTRPIPTERIKNRLKSQDFQSELITVESDEGGSKSLLNAIFGKQSPGGMDIDKNVKSEGDREKDFPTIFDDNDRRTFSKAKQRAQETLRRMNDMMSQRRAAMREAGLDPDRVLRGDHDVTPGDRRGSYDPYTRGLDFDDLNKNIRQDTGLSTGELRHSLRETMAMDLPGDGEGSIHNYGRGSSDGILPSLTVSRNGRTNTELIDSNRILKAIDNTDSLTKAKRRLSRVGDKLEGGLRKMFPSMRAVRSVMAAMIPVAIALGVQLLGVAAAMGAVAAAGAAIVGLGILGHGDSMSSSLSQAKEEASELAENLFQAAQPTMKQFAPIQSRIFDAIPGRVRQITEAMEGLTQFEGTLFRIGGMFADGMTEGLETVNENEDAISQLALRFAEMAGSGIKDFLFFLFEEARDGQSILVKLGSSLKSLAIALYRVSLAISKILTTFSPLVNILLFISKLLENDILATLVSIVGWMFVMGKFISILFGIAKGFIAMSQAISALILLVKGYEMSMWQAFAATMATVAALSLLTAGVGLALGGVMGISQLDKLPSGPSGSGSRYGGDGGRTVYNDNRTMNIDNGGSGGMDYGSERRLYNTMDDKNERDSAQNLPDFSSSD